MKTVAAFTVISRFLRSQALGVGMSQASRPRSGFINVTKWFISATTFLLSLCITYSANALTLAQTPLFVGQSAKPTIMFAMSRDHELFKAAYGDYSNLNGGKLTMADTTYRNDFTYAGYFDSGWCYDYDSSNSTISNRKFVPYSVTTDHKCAMNTAAGKGRWSGNFLNWATMSRMDILRKVLYGGSRAVDTAASANAAAQTILVRSYLPKDSHAFGKVFTNLPASGSLPASSVSDYTPYDGQTSMSFCNVSTASDSTGYPVIRVAKGAWAQWSHTEVQQCQWRGSGGNTTQVTSPSISTDKQDELSAKVSVCEPTKDALTNQYIDSNASASLNRCKSYESGSYKPVGLLQKFYTKVNFGLVTGTWGKQYTGGVLRKKASQLAGNTVSGTDDTNEFSDATGVFNANVMSSTTDTGIIKTIDAIKVLGLSYSSTSTSTSYSNTNDWGNPIGEIYAEALRYIIGKASPTSAFAATDTGFTSESSWNDPVPVSSWCSKCSIVILSSGPNSNDGDDLTSTFLASVNSSLTQSSLNTVTDSIGQYEFGSLYNTVYYGGNYSGSSPTLLTAQCTPTSLKMSQFLGKCPDYPASMGSYAVAGLAYWAHVNDQRTAAGYLGNQTINTFAVELSEGFPTLSIPMGPDSDPNKKTFSFSPVCINTSSASGAKCGLVGVVVENFVYLNNDTTQQPISGSYLFYWEDQPAGSDYDLDGVQRIQFCVGPTACGDNTVASNQIKITNSLPYWETGTGSMEMSYIVSGVNASTDILQSDQYVHRSGYSVTGITSILTTNNTTWYNALGSNISPRPAWSDPLPANTKTETYITSKIFTPNSPGVTSVQTPLYYAAKYGSFLDDPSTSNANHIPDKQAEWDSKSLDGSNTPDGIPDGYFMMKNPSQLESSLSAILTVAVDQVSSGSGVSTNSTKLDTGTRIYQARFYTNSWYGELRSMSLDTSSGGNYTTVWSTLNHLNSATGRKVFSSSSGAGISFDATNWSSKYTSAQKTALGGDTNGPNVVSWVLGNDVAGYRSRTETTYTTDANGNQVVQYNGVKQLMGDIVNSTPVYSGAAGQGYENLDSAYGSSSYLAYVTGTKATRNDVVYVGANDGMLHAIDAQTGSELFAYVPSMIYSKLPTIASPFYGITTPHTYTVDGPLAVGDAYINGSWKTILVGTLGAGAAGIFALDVTDPKNFSSSNVLFEINTDTGATYQNDVGNVMGKPLIAPVAGGWKVIFGNGYNSAGGTAKLFVIDIAKPFDNTQSKVITAAATASNGLAGPTAIQNATTGAVSYVYAGDLFGNMWKFDLSSSSISSWGVGLSGSPLFIAKGPSPDNNLQPIFAAPTLGINAQKNNATMVYFGTGKYIETNDISATQMALHQSFYGIADQNASVTYTTDRTTVLQQKTMTVSSDGKTRDVNDSGANAVAVDWATKKGWFLDFPAGEIIVSKPLLLYDRLLFSTIVPNTDACSFGGSGWLMELVGVGDVFGTSKQLLPNNGTFLNFFLPGDLTKLSSSAGTILNECNIKGTCSSQVLSDPPISTTGMGRISWRQVR